MAFFNRSTLPILALSLFGAIVLGQLQQGPQGPPPPPPFLQGAPQQKIDEFQHLLENSGHNTDDQIEADVKEWISKQDDDVKTKFAAFEEEKKKMEEAQEQAHQQAIKNFSPKAKEADAKLSEIAKHPGLAAQEKAKQIQEYVQSLAPEVREEIEKAMQGPAGGQQ